MADESIWNLDSLKAHFDSILTERDVRYTERFDAQEEAQRTLATELTGKFTNVNEFRGTLTDQAATFIPRSEFDAKIEALTSRINSLGWVSLVQVLIVVGAIVALAAK